MGVSSCSMASWRLASSPSAACRVSFSRASASSRNWSLFCCRAAVDSRANSPVSCSAGLLEDVGPLPRRPGARGPARRSAGPPRPGAGSARDCCSASGTAALDLGGQARFVRARRPAGPRPSGPRSPGRRGPAGPTTTPSGGSGDESDDESGDHDRVLLGARTGPIAASVPTGCDGRGRWRQAPTRGGHGWTGGPLGPVPPWADAPGGDRGGRIRRPVGRPGPRRQAASRSPSSTSATSTPSSPCSTRWPPPASTRATWPTRSGPSSGRPPT